MPIFSLKIVVSRIFLIWKCDVAYYLLTIFSIWKSISFLDTPNLKLVNVANYFLINIRHIFKILQSYYYFFRTAKWRIEYRTGTREDRGSRGVERQRTGRNPIHRPKWTRKDSLDFTVRKFNFEMATKIWEVLYILSKFKYTAWKPESCWILEYFPFWRFIHDRLKSVLCKKNLFFFFI